MITPNDRIKKYLALMRSNFIFKCMHRGRVHMANDTFLFIVGPQYDIRRNEGFLPLTMMRVSDFPVR